MTSLGASGCHSAERSVAQRLGPPGALPVKPGGLINFSSFFVSAGFSSDLKLEVKTVPALIWHFDALRDHTIQIDSGAGEPLLSKLQILSGGRQFDRFVFGKIFLRECIKLCPSLLQGLIDDWLATIVDQEIENYELRRRLLRQFFDSARGWMYPHQEIIK